MVCFLFKSEIEGEHFDFEGKAVVRRVYLTTKITMIR
jgi:hypothetical protein